MAGKVRMLVTILGEINSRALYDAIKQYSMNVCDMGDRTLVYNLEPVSEQAVVSTLCKCCEYGKCEIKILYSATNTLPYK